MSKSVTNRKMKIAIVGCGRISSKHFDAIAAHADSMELAAICDTNRTILAELEKQYAVPAYHDYADLLSHADIDLAGSC